MTQDNVVQLKLFKEETPQKVPAEFEDKLVISYEHIVHALEYYLKTMNLWPYSSHTHLIDADFGLELNADDLVEVDLTLIEEFAN